MWPPSGKGGHLALILVAPRMSAAHMELTSTRAIYMVT